MAAGVAAADMATATHAISLAHAISQANRIIRDQLTVSGPVTVGEAAVFVCLHRHLIRTDMDDYLRVIFECYGSYDHVMSMDDWECQEAFSLQLFNLIHVARGEEEEVDVDTDYEG